VVRVEEADPEGGSEGVRHHGRPSLLGTMEEAQPASFQQCHGARSSAVKLDHGRGPLVGRDGVSERGSVHAPNPLRMCRSG
jgi:hypothetical protein